MNQRLRHSAFDLSLKVRLAGTGTLTSIYPCWRDVLTLLLEHVMLKKRRHISSYLQKLNLLSSNFIVLRFATHQPKAGPWSARAGLPAVCSSGSLAPAAPAQERPGGKY